MKIVGFLLMICITNSWAQDLLPMMPGIVLPDITTPKSPLPLGDKEVIPPNTEKPDEEERLIRCKRPLCDMVCAYGFAVGEDGCPICKCKTPEDLCHEHGDCPEGTRCQVPTCFGDLCASVKPECIPECPLLDCSPCPGGVYLKDERGCQTCECEDMLCPVPMCSEPCPNGYANDEHGCMTCKCNTEPQSQKKQATSEEKHVEVDSDEKSSSEEEELEVSHCPLAMCRMYCRYGFEKDEHGCEMCKCRRQPEHCPQFMCLMYCEAGFDKDENGCDICQCRQQPIACPRRMCRMMMNCPNGFEKDERGCDMCMCKPASKHDICDGVTCPVGQSCKPVQPTDCVAGMCDPLPVCCPPSVCELHQGHIMPEDQIEMMMHHLAMPERENFFAGPARCKPDGHFEPKQCLQEQCFCVDDRSVMQLTSLMMDDPDCRDNITKEMRLSFQLEHDLDDNNLDGALQDIEGLVKATLGDWMAVSRDSVVLVQVAYSKPGMLFVQATVIHDGLSDLTSASHYMHRLMHDGHCNLNYKNHVLKPKPDTIHFEHHYETTPEILAYNDMCTGPMCFSNLMFPFCGIGIALFSVILFTTLYIIVKRRRLINNQFRHRRMEDNFRKNLVLSCELEKPELLAGDDVKVTLSDATEDKSVA